MISNENRFFLVMVLVYLVILVGQTIQHEAVHEQAAIHAGCIDYETVIRPLGHSYFACYEYSNRTEEMKNNEYVIDQFNEVISYNLDITNLILVLGILIIGTFLIEIKESNKRKEIYLSNLQKIMKRYW